MRYEKNAKNIIIILIILIEIVSIFLMLPKKIEYTELPRVRIKGLSSGTFAILLEQNYNKGDYKEEESGVLPTDGYIYNEEKSGCIDRNGNEIKNVLSYNYRNKTIGIKTNREVYCYLYYDKLNALKIRYDGTKSGTTCKDVQCAIDELYILLK